jgi:hypothetical protein
MGRRELEQVPRHFGASQERLKFGWIHARPAALR